MNQLQPEFLAQYVNQPVPFGPVGEVTYKRTYSRAKESGGKETWLETQARCVNALLDLSGGALTMEEAQRMFHYAYNLKGSVSGRALWQLGTETVARFGTASLQNCFDGSTQFITKEGITSLKEAYLLQESGEKPIEVLDRFGAWREATVNTYGVQPINKIVFGLPGTSKHTQVVYATPNHRWYLKGQDEATDNLSVGDRVIAEPADVVHDDDLFGFCWGFIFGDGCRIEKYPNRFVVDLCGDKAQHLQKFLDLKHDPRVKDVKGPRENSRGEPVVTVVLYDDQINLKAVPVSEDYAVKRAFFEGWLAADGSIRPETSRNPGQIRLSTQNLTAQTWLQAHAGVLGYLVTGRTEETRATNFGERSAPLVTFTVRRESVEYVVKSIEYSHADVVYCVEEPETRSFTLAGGIPTGNCWCVAVKEPEAFCFAFDMLMLGGGVGFNIQREYVYQLPELVPHAVSVEHVDTAGADFLVPDTREGWVELLWKVLNCYFGTSDNYLGKLSDGFTYSTINVRGKDEVIHGFGGKASGPQVLVEGIAEICKVLDRRLGKKLRPIDCLDVLNIIGSVVVAGNVRRSAMIALGDTDDYQYLEAKRWDKGNIPNWRAMSNNTIVANEFGHVREETWMGYEGKGEPYGFLNLNLAKNYGRLKDGKVDDTWVIGVNPCGEISLEHMEACNLNETFLPNIDSEEELIDVLCTFFKASKIITTLPCHWPQADEVLKRNRRIGTSLTGIWQAREWFGPESLDRAYAALEECDVEFSERLSNATGQDVRPSIKRTTVKPSGTLSLLAGVAPGIHPEFHEFYIRRIRMASSDDLVTRCRAAGYPVEYVRKFDGTDDRDTVCIEFPVKARPGRTADQVTAVEMLEKVKEFQYYWADNQVSATVYYTPEELPEVQDWLDANYDSGLKGISFLLKSNHGFDQAPIEAIGREEYYDRCGQLSELDLSEETSSELLDMANCAGGACPIR